MVGGDTSPYFPFLFSKSQSAFSTNNPLPPSFSGLVIFFPQLLCPFSFFVSIVWGIREGRLKNWACSKLASRPQSKRRKRRRRFFSQIPKSILFLSQSPGIFLGGRGCWNRGIGGGRKKEFTHASVSLHIPPSIIRLRRRERGRGEAIFSA